MVENVFVLGLDAHNADVLHGLPDAARYRFHPLLSDGELSGGESVDLPGLLDAAQRQVEAFDGPVHALVGFWDFPISTMVPILCERLGLRWASTEAVVKCEHKYWSRLEQSKVIDEIPGFGLLDLDDPRLPEGLGYPVWIKPIRSASSQLAFRADDPRQLVGAAATIRSGIRRIGDAFGTVLDLLELPPELAGVGGSACLVEESAAGRLVTVEGYSRHDQVHVYGIVDSVTVPGGTSFLRYQYPSSIPDAVSERMVELTRRVIRQIGYDGATFNVGSGPAATAPRRPVRRGGQVVRAPQIRRRGPSDPDRRGDRAGRAGDRRLRRRGDRRAGRAPVGAARPGQLQLRGRERLPRRGERGRPGPQVQAGGGSAAVRDRPPRSRSALNNSALLRGAQAAPRCVVVEPDTTPVSGPPPPCDASTWITARYGRSCSAPS
jgi:hypothetical protein